MAAWHQSKEKSEVGAPNAAIERIQVRDKEN
jgi:hypothetical protein